ncbi:MAG: hypothetical protein K8I00_04055, partial [Candidatus Omnitrophica bacterium]|nr:hypothetical protein [Candidatus Omnitrophota bacterium]
TLFEKVLRNIKNSNIFTVLRNDSDPVALVIDADGITPDPRVVDFVFVYRPGYFYSLTQIVDRPGGTGSLAQGGIRYKVLNQRDARGRLRPQDEVSLEIFESAFAEVDMTSRSKYIRNIITQTPYSGAKTLMSVYPDSKNIKTSLLKSLARALVDAGVTSRYVIGTESGMTAGDQDTMAQAIGDRYLDHLHLELEQLKTLKSIGQDLSKIKSTSSYGQHLRELQDTNPEQGRFLTDPLIDALRQRVVASLYLGQQNGGTSLVKLFNSPLRADIQRTLGAVATGRLTDTELNALKEWSLGAFSAAMSIEAINEYMPESKLRSKKIGIRGATTGGALALMLTRLGYTVVAIEDINGTVYKEEGFSIAELGRLDAIDLNNRNVLKWMPEQDGVVRHLPKDSLGDKDQVDLDILVSVAPGHRLDDEGVARLRGREDSDGRDPLVYIEAGFNSINGHERELHRKGILAFKSTSIGFGGAYGSYLEDYIKHRFTSEQLTRYILRVRDSSSDAEVVTDSDAKVNDRILVSDYRSDVPQGEVILENGKVVHSTIGDILEGMSVDINDGQLYSQGIALPFRHRGFTRTVIWDNYIVVFNEKGLIRQSNHPELIEGHQVTFMDPTQEIRITAYQDIKGIAKRMNTMVMELVRRGLDNGQRQYQITPGQAVRRITKLIDAKKNEFDTTKDETITEAIQQIMDKLEADGFYFPQHVARKIAIKRLVSSSDIPIKIGDEDFLFNAEGYLVEKSETDTDENFYNVRMTEALSGSFDFSLRTAHELEERLRA